MGNRIVLLYPSNLVVVADMLTCDVKGLYMGSASGFHPLVREHARHAIGVASDKRPPPGPPPGPATVAHPHDVTSAFRGTRRGHHAAHNPAHPRTYVTHVCLFWTHVVNALEFKWGSFNMGWKGRTHGHSYCLAVPAGSCITALSLRSGGFLDGIQFYMQGRVNKCWNDALRFRIDAFCIG